MSTESDGLNQTEPIITKVQPLSQRVERIQNLTPTKVSRLPLDLELLRHDDELTENSKDLSFFDQVKLTWVLIPYLLKMIGGVIMKDWKTTITAVLGGIAAIINYATGFVVPQGVIEFVTMIAGFYFAADGKKGQS